MLWVPLAVALLALPGLCLARHGRGLARAAAALAVVALLAAALDLQGVATVPRPAHVVAVPTAPAETEAARALARALAPVTMEVRAGEAPLEQRAAAAWLSDCGADRVQSTALLWDAPFTPGAPLAGIAAGAVAVTAVAPPPVEPSAVELHVIAPLEAGRPGALELRLAAPGEGLAGSVEIRSSDGATALAHTLAAGELASGAPVRLTFTPAAPGPAAVEVVLGRDGRRLQLRGSLPVRPARPVFVVGQQAAELVRALAVQGVAASASPALPQTLTEEGVVVLLDPLAPAEQERLATLVEDGLGLLVVGGPGGGALPSPDEPLHARMPVICPPRAAAPAGDAAGAGAKPRPGKKPEAAPAREDPEPEPAPEPTQPESPLARGDTGGAREVPGPEVLVERRLVAMVLLVDRSGSMADWVVSGRSKLDYAKTAAYETARALHDGDLLGVVTFGVNGHVVLPMTSAGEEQRVLDVLSRIGARDQATLGADALVKASKLLAGVDAAVKHIVLISDGQIHDADLAAPMAVMQARRDGITVSVIQIGGESARASDELAKRGGGVFRRTLDPSEVPRLVSAEVVGALGQVGRRPRGALPGEAAPPGPPAEPKAEAEEPQAPPPPEPAPPEQELAEPPPAQVSAEPEPETLLPVVAVAQSPLLAPEGAFPPVGGVLPVKARGDAQTLLVARAGDEGIPLLALAHRGLGRVGVWTSDWLGPWGAAWRRDALFPARLAQWVTALMPPLPPEPGAALALSHALDPPAPTAAERAALERIAGPLRPVADFTPPPSGARSERRGRAADFAWLGAAALVLLAVVEALLARR